MTHRHTTPLLHWYPLTITMQWYTLKHWNDPSSVSYNPASFHSGWWGTCLQSFRIELFRWESSNSMVLQCLGCHSTWRTRAFRWNQFPHMFGTPLNRLEFETIWIERAFTAMGRPVCKQPLGIPFADQLLMAIAKQRLFGTPLPDLILQGISPAFGVSRLTPGVLAQAWKQSNNPHCLVNCVSRDYHALPYTRDWTVVDFDWPFGMHIKLTGTQSQVVCQLKTTYAPNFYQWLGIHPGESYDQSISIVNK